MSTETKRTETVQQRMERLAKVLEAGGTLEGEDAKFMMSVTVLTAMLPGFLAYARHIAKCLSK